MQLVIIPLAAFLVSVLLHTLALTWFVKLNWLDNPEAYNLKRRKLPYPTGILLVLSFVLLFLVVAPKTPQTVGISVAVALLCLVSFIDDRKTVHPIMRLFVQALVASIIFATGTHIYTLTNPLLADGLINLDSIDILIPVPGQKFPVVLPVLSGLFTVFWLMLCMNALNWFDGIPGQVSILSTIGFAVIGALALSSRVDQPEVALLAFLLAGLSAGALLFDFPPARVVMGDTGAMFLGLMLGVLTIYSGGKVATAFLVLGVPLVDVFLVVTQRLLRRQSLISGNTGSERMHLHHRLLGIGWSERKVIFVTASLGSAFGLSALFMSSTEKILAGATLFVVMIALWLYSKQ